LGLDFNPNRLQQAFQNRLNAQKKVSGPEQLQEQQAAGQVGAQQAFANAALQFGQQSQAASGLNDSQRVGASDASRSLGQTQFQPQQSNPFQSTGTQFPTQAVQFQGQTNALEGLNKVDISRPNQDNQFGSFGPANFAQQNPYSQVAQQANGTKLWAMA
jgi:hypothetical protein